MASSKIPRPSRQAKTLNELRQTMNIGLVEFHAFKISVRSLVGRFLNVNKTLEDQSNEARGRFFIKVLEDNKPLLERFEGHWPVEEYARTHLSKRIGHARWREREFLKRSARTNASTQHAMDGGQGSRSRDESMSLSPPPAEQSVRRGTQHSEAAPDPTAASSSVSAEPLPDIRSPIEIFLTSIRPDFVRFATVFNEIGVNSAESIQLLASCAADVRREFLRSNLAGKANPLEIFVINTHLDRL
ncbi:hypothetical protein BJ138DRAFT_1102608 [Hygrophoropsis aurantiaca]|uniref:Uncharacterized protein n=1 Tax=Hygrophoropsis aurantiaca TaxID=72124 RepID=A0ACB8AA08_9AGAM|nr:hypothetical protein BJ138DRAFT_1102608 [Hygrophoropsis aurantiaca]